MYGLNRVCENPEEKQQVPAKPLTSVSSTAGSVEENMGAAPMALRIMMGIQPSPSGLG
jgi:hypothetical protein